MKLTVDTVQSVLIGSLGTDGAAIASAITTVEPRNDVPTACIDTKGHLQYNKEWAKKYLKTGSDLFCVIMHEALHKHLNTFLLGELRSADHQILNIAEDIYINALIVRLFPRESDMISLMRKMYKGNGIEAALRALTGSGAWTTGSKNLDHVIHKLSREYNRPPALTEVFDIVKLLFPLDSENMAKVLLLGDHGRKGRETGGAKESDPLTEAVLKVAGKRAGHYGDLLKLNVKGSSNTYTVRKDILKKYWISKKVSESLGLATARRLAYRPVPVDIGKLDTVLLAAGITPVIYRTKVYDHTRSKEGRIAIYLDVSGSVTSELPSLIKVVDAMEDVIEKVYLFSNKVVETTVEAVRNGDLESTGGTDFDCVFESIAKNQHKRAVIITDGYAHLSEEVAKKVADLDPIVLTLITRGGKTNVDTEKYGKVMYLKDIVKGPSDV